VAAGRREARHLVIFSAERSGNHPLPWHLSPKSTPAFRGQGRGGGRGKAEGKRGNYSFLFFEKPRACLSISISAASIFGHANMCSMTVGDAENPNSDLYYHRNGLVIRNSKYPRESVLRDENICWLRPLPSDVLVP